MPAFGPCRRACGCAGLFFLPPDSAVLSVFAASLFAPSFFPSSVFLPVFRFSLAGPHLPLPASPSARISLCPFLPLPASLSARISPALSGRPPSSVFRLVFLLSFLVFPFIVHRPPLVVRRLLSVARCAVHRPALAACCPLPIVYPLPPIVYPLPPIVHPLPPIVYPLPPIVHPLPPVARNLPPAVHRLLRRPYPVAFICTPSPRRASFRCRSVRITAFVSAESRPACLRELLAVSFRSGFRRSVFPQKCPPPSVPWSPRRF